MPTILLGPNQNIPVRFPSGRTGRIRIYVEASDPVTVHVTTAAGHRAFKERAAIVPLYASEKDVMLFERSLWLPADTEYLMLLINFAKGAELDDSRAIYYRVMFER